MEKARQLVDEQIALAENFGIQAKGKTVRPGESTVEQITDYADREKIDLIVIGTRGLGGFKRLLLGSVSSGVVSHAPCSVLVVR